MILKTKLEDSYFLISKLNTKLQESRQCGYGEKIDSIQWNIIESPQIDSDTYSQFIFDKDARIFNGKEQSQIGVTEATGIHTPKNEAGPLPVAHGKIN